MKSFSYTELDKLAGEVLPERAVLSTLLVGGGHGDGHTVTTSSCSANSNQPQMGLLSLFQVSPAGNSQICTPANTALNG
ncbi:hypothetical protein SAMN05443665_1010110 [Actinomadura meyerae]|jgi:hypothetical protein|uniref:Uncharacterized protein n=1 Tax=Actinomadura meyerae TaxID=240840 RepID=A0A239HS32_9ACTN|nr:hypothetical protein [Actinomadura meyerae]AQQ74946.1 hypothetical protein [uncultured bacterium]SNS83888.1 hypothetical protein SAMN05443665_1010110 [Actinomadura meyerae]